MGLAEKASIALLAMQRHSWEQGCAMQAFYEMGRMELVVPMALEAANRAMEDGRPATIGVTDAVTDPCSVGQALHAAAQQTGDERLKAADQALLLWALERAPRSGKGILYHLNTGKQFWADSLYMLPPYLTFMGYPREALVNFFGIWDALMDPESGLLCHIWDEGKGRFADAAHWGSGNGWALAGAARMIRLLKPQTDFQRERRDLEERAGRLLESVLAFQKEDGSFPNILDDPESFPEWNLSQMTAYTIYCGICDGWLDDTLRERADRLRAGARRQMDADGFIRPVCGAPYFDRPGISPEAQAFFLLMEQAACEEENKTKRAERSLRQ